MDRAAGKHLVWIARQQRRLRVTKHSVNESNLVVPQQRTCNSNLLPPLIRKRVDVSNQGKGACQKTYRTPGTVDISL
jgi:hypothetical protein